MSCPGLGTFSELPRGGDKQTSGIGNGGVAAFISTTRVIQVVFRPLLHVSGLQNVPHVSLAFGLRGLRS